LLADYKLNGAWSVGGGQQREESEREEREYAIDGRDAKAAANMCIVFHSSVTHRTCPTVIAELVARF